MKVGKISQIIPYLFNINAEKSSACHRYAYPVKMIWQTVSLRRICMRSNLIIIPSPLAGEGKGEGVIC